MQNDSPTSLDALLDTACVPAVATATDDSDASNADLDTLMDGGLSALQMNTNTLVANTHAAETPKSPSPIAQASLPITGAQVHGDASGKRPPFKRILCVVAGIIVITAGMIGVIQKSKTHPISVPNAHPTQVAANAPTPIAPPPTPSATAGTGQVPVATTPVPVQAPAVPAHAAEFAATPAIVELPSPADVPTTHRAPSADKKAKAIAFPTPARPKQIKAATTVAGKPTIVVHQAQVSSRRPASPAPTVEVQDKGTRAEPPQEPSKVPLIVGHVAVGDRLSTGEVVLDVTPNGDLITDMRIIKKE